MKIVVNGVTIESGNPILAINQAILTFGFEPDLAEVITWALNYVRAQAAEAENSIDDILAGNFVRGIMLNQEVVEYYKAGRPANPSANVYVISAAMAARRGITLHDMLELLFAKWRNVQGRIAQIATELDRLTEEIEAAGTVEEITAILATMEF